MSRRRARPVIRRRAVQRARTSALKTVKTVGRVVAILAAVEIAARVLWEPPAGPNLDVLHQGLAMAAHETRMWSMRPGPMETFGETAVISEDGLREVSSTGAPLRILTLGDSSIFGFGLSDADTLHARLQGSLAARGVEVDVLCGALPGYSTEQTLLLLDEVGWDLDPDLVIVANLWSDNTFETFVDREWLALLNNPAARLDRALSVSHAWTFLRETVAPKEALDTDREVNFVAWIAEPYANERRRVELSHYAENLDRVLLQAAERDAGAVVLQLINRDRMANQPGSWDPYLAAQRRVAGRRGVLALDGLEAVRGGDLHPRDALLDMMHPTGASNALMAEALADILVDAGWPGDRLLPDTGPPLFSESLAEQELVDDLAGAQGPILGRAPVGPYQEEIPEEAFQPGLMPTDARTEGGTPVGEPRSAPPRGALQPGVTPPGG